jgi:hypothetical protein
MVFSEKLKILMDLTNTSNKRLANYLIVDPSMVSQLRTGARNVTRKNNHVKNMAFYFADKCQSPSRMLALHELIQNDELEGECSIDRLSDIIYEFLLDENAEGHFGSMLQPENAEIFKNNPRIRKAELIPHELSAGTLLVCRDIEEKKKYMKMLFEYFMTLQAPEVIYFSSEEVVDWIYCDPEFYNNFRSWGLALIEKGFSFVRIMKPMENKEHFLENILLWFPLYMTGQVYLYYYPHFRDDIYRQTIITVDQAASYFSSSIARTNTCYYSFVSADPDLSASYVKQIKDYLALCRPSFHICKTESSIATAFSKLMAFPGDRITKSYQLSPESIPYTEMLEYMSASNNETYRQAVKEVKRLYSVPDGMKAEYVVIDMCTLASAEDIRAGKVRLQLPGFVTRNPLYYNVDLYALHLRYILHMLETNPNYHFYPIEPSAFGEYGDDYAPVSAVDNHAVILVAENAVIHFTQPDMIHTLYEHLYTEARKLEKHSKSREKIMEEIRELLDNLNELC